MAERSVEGWPPPAGVPERISPSVIHLLSPNAGFMSYEGTNTWIIGAPGGGEAAVLDVGTRSSAHREAIIQAAGDAGWRITTVIASHGHGDHSEGARELADAVGAEVLGFGEVVRAELRESRPLELDRPLVDGETIELGDAELRVVWTPGHSTDSISLHLPSEQFVLTGDTVLGGHTGAVFGGMRRYLESLALLGAIVDEHPDTRFLPGHGPIVDDPSAAIDYLVAGRMRRLADVRSVVNTGVTEAEQIVDVLYPGRTGHARMPALVTVQTYLEYMADEHVDAGETPQ